MSSSVSITYDDINEGEIEISGDVLYDDATFEHQMNAAPGTCSFRVHDPDQVYSFVTGREVRLFIDGVPMWGGYIRRVNCTFAFSADDTSVPETYTGRIWLIEGADYNILFDNFFIRRTANYTTHVPNNTGYDGTTMDGWVLRKMLEDFCDFPSGFDITTQIDDVTSVLPSTSSKKFKYKRQGTKIRDQFDEQAKRSRASFYIGAEKAVHYHSWESRAKRWGFSDNPNYNLITASPSSYQGATWGFHEVTGEEDGSMIVNDVMIWGGSPIGSNGTVLFKRQDDQDSIDDHNRWQLAEAHFGESGFGVQSGVDARANVILNGPPGSTGTGALKGLRYPQWVFRFNWWADMVPLLSGDPDHIVAGDLVFVSLDTFGVEQNLPCRTLRVTFPQLDPEGNAYPLISGDFSLSYTDSIGLWAAIMSTAVSGTSATVTTTGDDSDSATLGSYGTFTPVPAPDGSTVLFSLKINSGTTPVGYIAGTLEIYLNGLLQRRGTDYAETSPTDGTFTMTTAPEETDVMVARCRTLDA